MLLEGYLHRREREKSPFGISKGTKLMYVQKPGAEQTKISILHKTGKCSPAMTTCKTGLGVCLGMDLARPCHFCPLCRAGPVVGNLLPLASRAPCLYSWPQLYPHAPLWSAVEEELGETTSTTIKGALLQLPRTYQYLLLPCGCHLSR